MTGTGLSIVPPTSGPALRPGESLELTLEWSLAAAPRTLEARLFWFTRGKGTVDVFVVETQPAPVLSAQGQHRFRFKLPEAPYSFSGTLISLVWAVDFVADETSAHFEFTMAPEGKEILLKQPEYETRAR